MIERATILPPIFFTFFEKYLRKLYDMITALQGKVATLDVALREKTKALEEAQAEIRRLKKLPKKPKLEPSKLDEPQEQAQTNGDKKRPGSEKKSKKAELKIHQKEPVKAKDVPTDWVLKGYRPYVIQDMIIKSNNIEYQREVWQSPDGSQTIVATLPVHLQGKQFGAILQTYILHQYYECCVSQPLIYTTLKDYGVQISKGQISNILIEGKSAFHLEKASLLSKAIELKEELRTDDTGARHGFKNGYCNCINSDLFTYFTTTHSKSRINFLEILRQNHRNYELNEAAISYIEKMDLPPKYKQTLQACHDAGRGSFKDKATLVAYFKSNGWTAKYALRTITEALLIGAIIAHGFDEQTLIHSDGAGQFDLFVHGLCWKHAERPLVKLVCYHDEQQALFQDKKKAFWSMYQDLKAYKLKPDKQRIAQLEQQFDNLCEPVLNFASLNQVLEDLKAKKNKLLLVLYRPQASLHNNDSERDIREYAKRRKISAGTRSENGKNARDTFLSLKKTCRKLTVSFWDYLLDRLTNANNILPLSLIMEQQSITANA